MRAHGGEARVDGALLAVADRIHRRLHVVVDAAPGHAAEGDEGPRVRIEQHLVALGRIGHQPEGAAGGELHMRHLEPPPQSADKDVLAAPVELERFARRKHQRHERGPPRGLVLLRPPAPHPDAHPHVTAAVAERADLLVQRLDGAPLALAAVRIGLERRRQRLGPGIDTAAPRPCRVLRFGHAGPAQPLPHGVPRQARALGHFADRQAFAQPHPPDLRQHPHVDHSRRSLLNS